LIPSGSPRLARMTIFPVKSLDGLEVEEVRVRGEAGLEHDREYRLVDDEERVIDGKQFGEKLIRLRSTFDLAFGEISLDWGGDRLSVRLPRDADDLQRWLSERLEREVFLERDPEKGFPDDEAASGPTVISRATLAEVATWFGLDENEVRRRFRANLEIDGVPAFWEDCLYGREGETRRFLIGDVLFEGVNPCARCTVPSRDSHDGEIREPAFAKIFAERRRERLPEWAEASRFDHYYRLSVNTFVPMTENGKTLRDGDEVRLI
jgi:MOSC domain-containing protein